jgi:hypothetical protein
MVSGANIKYLLLAVLFAAALGVRFMHMTGPLDGVAWRQAETAYMTKRMAEESPPDILHVKVPYRGTKDVHLAEFPVQPFLTALLYKLIGGENLLFARMTTLLFFLGAAWYLFGIVELLIDRRTALYTVIAYALLPLGIFYSRAVHVDFCVIFFSHAYLYYSLRFFQDRRWRFYVLAVAGATGAFLMKAPYCFYLALPLGAWLVCMQKRPRRVMGDLCLAGLIFVIPLIAAYVYNEYRIALEAGETESLIFHSKWTHDLARNHFFGAWQQRLNGEAWYRLLYRAAWEVTTPIGLVLALVGLAVLPYRDRPRVAVYVWAWLVGVLAYVLLIFPIVTSEHDYYSLPLLVPASLLIGVLLARLEGDRGGGVRLGLSMAVMVVLMLASLDAMRRFRYFHVDWQRVLAGQVIREHTSPGELVLSVTLGRSTGYSDPRILYYADRRGWAIEARDLNERKLERYREAGTAYAGLLVAPPSKPSSESFGVLKGYPHTVYEIEGPDRQRIGHMVLFDLEAEFGTRIDALKSRNVWLRGQSSGALGGSTAEVCL